MNKYIKESDIITASSKAFKIIYKHQGYKPLDDEMNTLTDDFNDELKYEDVENYINKDINDLVKLTMEELKIKAKELGIEIHSKMKKQEIIECISEM